MRVRRSNDPSSPPPPRSSCDGPQALRPTLPPPPKPRPARPLERSRARRRAVPSGPGCGPPAARWSDRKNARFREACLELASNEGAFSNQLRVPSGPGCGALWAARGPAQGCAGCGPLGCCSSGLTDRPIWVRVFGSAAGVETVNSTVRCPWVGPRRAELRVRLRPAVGASARAVRALLQQPGANSTLQRREPSGCLLDSWREGGT